MDPARATPETAAGPSRPRRCSPSSRPRPRKPPVRNARPGAHRPPTSGQISGVSGANRPAQPQRPGLPARVRAPRPPSAGRPGHIRARPDLCPPADISSPVPPPPPALPTPPRSAIAPPNPAGSRPAPGTLAGNAAFARLHFCHIRKASPPVSAIQNANPVACSLENSTTHTRPGPPPPPPAPG